MSYSSLILEERQRVYPISVTAQRTFGWTEMFCSWCFRGSYGGRTKRKENNKPGLPVPGPVFRFQRFHVDYACFSMHGWENTRAAAGISTSTPMTLDVVVYSKWLDSRD